MSLLTCCGVATYAALAAYYDIRERRIPNWLSGAALLAALPIAAAPGGVGIASAGTGFLLGGLVFFAPFALNAVGAGDVKFVAVAGAWLGPQVGFHALLLGTALGFFAAFGAAAWAGRAGEAISGAARLAYLAASSFSLANLPAPDREAARLAPIPYAVPLAGGIVGAVLLARHSALFF